MSDETNEVPAPDADPAPAGAPEAPVDDTAPLTVEDLVVTLEAVTAERDDYLDRWQRLSAEFANFKKQTDKRNADFAAQAGSKVAEALLPVLDACDAAAQQGVEGVEPIAGQLRGELV